MTETEWITAQNLDRRHLSEDAYATAQAALNRILRKEAKERQKAGQFDKVKASKAAEARHAVTTKRSAPQKRDRKAGDARSTAGQVAAKAGVSLRKAKQAVKLDQAVEAGVIPEECGCGVTLFAKSFAFGGDHQSRVAKFPTGKNATRPWRALERQARSPGHHSRHQMPQVIAHRGHREIIRV